MLSGTDDDDDDDHDDHDDDIVIVRRCQSLVSTVSRKRCQSHKT